MTKTTIEAIVAEVGINDILGFRCKNGYKIMYTRAGHLFKLEDIVTMGDMDVIKYVHLDTTKGLNLEAISFIELEEICQVYTADVDVINAGLDLRAFSD